MSGGIKKQLDKYKSRQQGGETAGFVLSSTGELEIIDPPKMKTMNPVKLKALLKAKGIAGSFAKGPKCVVFTIMAGKQGGQEGQPWIRLHLKDKLRMGNFELETASDADVDPDPRDLIQTKTNEEDMGLSTLFDSIEEEDVDPSFIEDWGKVAKSLGNALDTVDSGLTNLKKALATSKDQELEDIAAVFFGTGFPHIHGPHNGDLVAKVALVENETKPEAYKDALDAASGAARAYLEHLESSQMVEACDDNPAVSVGIIDTMTVVIGELQELAKQQSSAL